MKHLLNLSFTWSFFVSWALRILSAEWVETEPARALENVLQGTAQPVVSGTDWGGPRAISTVYFLEPTDSDEENTKQNTTTTPANTDKH